MTKTRVGRTAALIALIGLSACAQQLSEEDRALLSDVRQQLATTQAEAEAASGSAQRAEQSAQLAARKAEEAAADARRSREASDRMFQRSTMK